jgi:hypothetical protein
VERILPDAAAVGLARCRPAGFGVQESRVVQEHFGPVLRPHARSASRHGGSRWTDGCAALLAATLFADEPAPLAQRCAWNRAPLDATRRAGSTLRNVAGMAPAAGPARSWEHTRAVATGRPVLAAQWELQLPGRHRNPCQRTPNGRAQRTPSGRAGGSHRSPIGRTGATRPHGRPGWQLGWVSGLSHTGCGGSQSADRHAECSSSRFCRFISQRRNGLRLAVCCRESAIRLSLRSHSRRDLGNARADRPHAPAAGGGSDQLPTERAQADRPDFRRAGPCAADPHSRPHQPDGPATGPTWFVLGPVGVGHRGVDRPPDRSKRSLAKGSIILLTDALGAQGSGRWGRSRATPRSTRR